MSIELKIKSKTLATEASYIRKEERKQLGYARYCAKTNHADPAMSYAQYHKLHWHRVNVVRPAARLTNVARGFIKGHKYADIEKSPREELNAEHCKRIAKMVADYTAEPVTLVEVSEWIGGTPR